jgi:conjugal transfer pilus assembly protein TraU
LFSDVGCLEVGGFDLAYFSEVDPMWDDDLLAFILNPEAILFGNPAAQLSCAIDSLAAVAGLPLDSMFWCAGSQGSIYPFTGNAGTRASNPSNAVLMTERMNAKLHREGLILESSSTGLCFAHYSPILPKSRYRYQFTNPIPSYCSAYGRTTMFDNDALQNSFLSREN